MRTGILSLAVLAGCVSPAHGEAAAWNRPVLVELFTSQGCSSCPAADALVRELPALGYGPDRVLPLTLHVSYWDDLGWKDPFSSPAFTARQQWYARSGRLRSPDVHAAAREIYTPQMIVGGTVHFSGARRAVALAELQRAGAGAATARVSGEATARGDAAVVTVRVSPIARPDPSWRLFVALAARTARTKVSSGENEGLTLDEAHVVRTLSGPTPLGGEPRDPITVRLPKPAALPWSEAELVAFVQSVASLEIAGAAAIPLQP
jgi:hypothetical protein